MYEYRVRTIYFENVCLVLQHDQDRYGWILKIDTKCYIYFNKIFETGYLSKMNVMTNIYDNILLSFIYIYQLSRLCNKIIFWYVNTRNTKQSFLTVSVFFFF